MTREQARRDLDREFMNILDTKARCLRAGMNAEAAERFVSIPFTFWRIKARRMLA